MTKHRLILVLAVAALTRAATAQTPLTTIKVAPNVVGQTLNRPVYVCQAPGDSRYLYVLEKLGLVRVIDNTTGNVSTVIDINATVSFGTSESDERGLLGMTIHPNFATNRFFYLYFTIGATTADGYDTIIRRYTMLNTTPPTAMESSNVDIVRFDEPTNTIQPTIQIFNHKGGNMNFGPDGMLYVGLGDGGDSNDNHVNNPQAGCPNGNAQCLGSLLGKMLRINPSTTAGVGGYTVPPGNPNLGAGSLPEIWSYGLRNPWRWSFDRLTGEIYIADVGQGSREEVNVEPASTPGRNYGWRCREGSICNTSGTATPGCTCIANGACIAGITCPIAEYSHTSGRCSITGGYVYRGAAIEDLRGTYFFADYCGTQIYSIRYTGANIPEASWTIRTTELDPPGTATISRLVSFGQDNGGELYIVQQSTNDSSNTGAIWKIVPDCTSANMTISQQPQPMRVCPSGGTAMFTVAVSGSRGTTTYDWRRNTVSLGLPSSPTLMLNNVTAANVGNYSVVITDQCGSRTSNDAALTVGPPPADITGNCVRDSADITAFVNVLLGLDVDAGHVSRSDLNASGAADGDDVQMFFAAYTAP